MSKRKDIEFIHKVTGLSFGESRRLYKANGENLLLALGLEENLKSIAEAIPDICKGLSNAINSFCETFKNIDWSQIVKMKGEAENDPVR